MALGQYASLVGESGWRTQRLGRLFYFSIPLECTRNTKVFFFLCYKFDNALYLGLDMRGCGFGGSKSL